MESVRLVSARPSRSPCSLDLERRLHQLVGMSDLLVMLERGNVTGPVTAATRRRLRWEQAEGSPLPLGATWIETEQAFNFAVHAEHAESVTLLLYAPGDLFNPYLAYRFDFLRNKSGRIWHCRIPLSEIGDARYYGYSVSGEAVSYIHSFDPQKVLLDPYARCVFFPC